MSYNRLFAKILDSSIWLAPDARRIVWITLLAAMNRYGVAEFAHVRNLAARARVPLRAARSAIKAFESPDPHGMEQEFEGKRIQRIDGVGWLVLNAEKYRDFVSHEVLNMQAKERMRLYRARKGRGYRNVTEVTPSEHKYMSPASPQARSPETQSAVARKNPKPLKKGFSEKPGESAAARAEARKVVAAIPGVEALISKMRADHPTVVEPEGSDHE